MPNKLCKVYLNPTVAKSIASNNSEYTYKGATLISKLINIPSLNTVSVESVWFNAKYKNVQTGYDAIHLNTMASGASVPTKQIVVIPAGSYTSSEFVAAFNVAATGINITASVVGSAPYSQIKFDGTGAPAYRINLLPTSTFPLCLIGFSNLQNVAPTVTSIIGTYVKSDLSVLSSVGINITSRSDSTINNTCIIPFGDSSNYPRQALSAVFAIAPTTIDAVGNTIVKPTDGNYLSFNSIQFMNDFTVSFVNPLTGNPLDISHFEMILNIT